MQTSFCATFPVILLKKKIRTKQMLVGPGINISLFVVLKLIGRMTSLTASQITPWRLRKEMRTLTSDQKVETVMCVLTS